MCSQTACTRKYQELKALKGERLASSHDEIGVLKDTQSQDADVPHVEAAAQQPELVSAEYTAASSLESSQSSDIPSDEIAEVPAFTRFDPETADDLSEVDPSRHQVSAKTSDLPFLSACLSARSHVSIPAPCHFRVPNECRYSSLTMDLLWRLTMTKP